MCFMGDGLQRQRGVHSRGRKKRFLTLISRAIFNPVNWLTTSNQYLQSSKVQDIQENDGKTKQHITNFSLFIIMQYKY